MRALTTFLALTLSLGFTPGALAQGEAAAPKKKAKTSYIRVSRDEDGGAVAMEIATGRYEHPDTGVRVDLVGVVHVGEGHYYRALNRRLARYETVLYELVAPRGTRVPKKGAGTRSGNPIGMLQGFLKDSLGLESQLEIIDYHKDNFVHADLSMKEMGKAMRKRGDTPLTLALGVALDVMRQFNKQLADKTKSKDGKGNAASELSQMSPLALLLDPAGPSKLKRMMAVQMSESAVDGSGFKTLDTLLIKDRNAAALRVLDEQIQKQKKSFAIFYGAAHMPDFHKRLLAQGYVLKEKRWDEAWDLSIKKGGAPLLLKLFEVPTPKKEAPKKEGEGEKN